MRSIKTSVNLNSSLDNYCLAHFTDSRTSKLPKGILGWASVAERIERASIEALSALKEIWPLRSPLHSDHMLW